MSVRRTPDINVIVVSVTIAAVTALALFLILASLARPHGLQAGLAQATHLVDDGETKLQSPGDPYAYPAHALCRDQPQVAASALKDRLAAASTTSGASLTGLTMTAGVADEAAGGLAPVTVQFEADGRYDAVIGLLDTLNRAQPEIFVDTVDLKTAISSASLKFSGRIYCSPYVPL
jgi:Type II secretion system (T2SS), protein M subtype b